MSQVFTRGTLTPVSIQEDETMEDTALRIIKAHRKANRVSKKSKPVKLPQGYDNYVQLLEEELFEEYMVLDGAIYAIKEEELYEIFEASENGFGGYQYTVKYNDNVLTHTDAIKDAIGSI